LRYASLAQFIDLIGEIPLKAFLAALAISVLLSPLACSDDESGGSSAALGAVEAFSAFRGLLLDETVAECLLVGERQDRTCPCPAGNGTIEALYEPPRDGANPPPPTGPILREVLNCQLPNPAAPSDPSENITFTGGIQQPLGGDASLLCANTAQSGTCPVVTFADAPQLFPAYFDVRFNMAPGGSCEGFSGEFLQTDASTCSGYVEVSCGSDYTRCTVPADCSEMTVADCS